MALTSSQLLRRFRAFSLSAAVMSISVLFTIAVVGVGARAWSNSTALVKSPHVQERITVKPLIYGYVQRAGIWPQLRPALDAFGDRLEMKGKERLTIIGTIRDLSTDQSKTAPVKVISEFPDRLRVEKQDGPQLVISGFDGQTDWKLGGQLSQNEKDEIETLVHDTTEHFFAIQARGLPVRYLGSNFRLDDGEAREYTGSYYDIYQVEDQIPAGAGVSRSQIKRYFINSETQLLERIRYQIERNGDIVNVETQLSDWKKTGEQQFPGTVTRLENGKGSMTFYLTSAVFGPKVADGIFNKR